MRLDELFVIHHPGQHPFDVPQVSGTFSVKTCQRQIWVGPKAQLSNLVFDPRSETYSGEAAYRFLLYFSTGLASQVRGETDVFGQIKDAWNLNPTIELGPWIQRLFEDTKEIRNRYLQNTGGDGYGSLVRKLLRKTAPKGPDEPILVVGAGKIAASIAPWLLPNQIWIWNRSDENRNALAFDLKSKGANQIREIPSDFKSLCSALQETAHVVFCIPAGKQDQIMAEIWNESSTRSNHPRVLIHLGGTRAELPHFSNPLTSNPHALYLDDLFTLQKEQNEFRESLFQLAEKACDEKARLRSLSGSTSGSVTLPHGWEDLALFA